MHINLAYNIFHFSGYMAPEYASEGLFSVKSDVFSFGVLMIEILSGKRNSSTNQYGDFINLLGYVSYPV
jgi:serine/threonine protein kinase